MKKLLVFAAILSFCTAETYGLLKEAGGLLRTVVTQQLNSNGMTQPNTGVYSPINQQGNQYVNQTQYNPYGNQALNFTGNLQKNIGNFSNNLSTGIQQYVNQMQYNTGVMGTQVNSQAIVEILQKIYVQSTMLQSSYGTDQNIGTLIIKLNNVIMNCVSNPNQTLSQLPIICQYIVYIYSYLKQIGAGSQIEKLADGFFELFYVCLGINPEQ